MKDSAIKSERLNQRKTSGVRILEEGEGIERRERRAFLQILAAQGVAIPAAYLMLSRGVADAYAISANSDGSLHAAVPLPSSMAKGKVIRDFADPYLELIRLLREASEIEHALMVQYLYGAFSVKPAYAGLVGYGAPNSNDLLGVAIQEMQHLSQVNALMAALGATPNLIRQDFPYEPDVYPFEFNLEPLSQRSLAKYVYTEAPLDAFDRAKATSPTDLLFLDTMDRVLGTSVRPNHVGSLYDAVIRTLEEYIASPEQSAQDWKPWIAKLHDIKREGEDGHYHFFRRAFLGTHEGFKGHPAVWSLAPDDPAYPSRPLPTNPSAFVGHPNQIKDPTALSIAWLGNLHYWTILLLSDLAYTEAAPDYVALAKQQMMGPFWSIARYLPTLGAGMPFEALDTGYAPCRTARERLRFIAGMLGEADKLARSLKERLPADYPLSLGAETIGALNAKRAQFAANESCIHNAALDWALMV